MTEIELTQEQIIALQAKKAALSIVQEPLRQTLGLGRPWKNAEERQRYRDAIRKAQI